MLLLLFFPACSKRVYVPIERTVRVREVETVRDTVVRVKLVPFFAEVATSRDSSCLENEYAYSAAIWNGRELYHTLGIFDREFPVRVQYVDRFVYRTDSVKVPYPVTEFKEVNRLSAFQGFQVWCGRLFLLIVFERVFWGVLRHK